MDNSAWLPTIILVGTTADKANGNLNVSCLILMYYLFEWCMKSLSVVIKTVDKSNKQTIAQFTLKIYTFQPVALIII